MLWMIRRNENFEFISVYSAQSFIELHGECQFMQQIFKESRAQPHSLSPSDHISTYNAYKPATQISFEPHHFHLFLCIPLHVS